MAYRILFNKVFVALINASLEPYLGYVHTTKWGTRSLVYDFMEIYRYLADGFLIGYCRKLKDDDFILKPDYLDPSKKGKRHFLNNKKNKEFLAKIEEYFQSYVPIRRIRMGRKQRIETLIREEAMLLAAFLRCEKKAWIPRVVAL